MRKRTIIAVIFTIGAVLALNKFWLKFSSMPVDLDIQGKGMTNVGVIFNNKNNDSFYHIRQNGARINLDKKGHAEIFVDKAKFPKRIRIILSGFDGNKDFVLSNVQLRYGKLNLDLNKFKIEGGNSEVKNNKLFLRAKDEIVTLTYPDRLNIRASFKFDFMLFVIFTVLIYLLAFKLSDYIADFKTVKGKSRVDIIFLAVFFICLCIPASNINQDRISVQENRTLAAWQPLFQPEYGINYNFGNDFNNWFNDRFAGREKIIKLFQQLTYYSNKNYIKVNETYLCKNTGWMYFTQNRITMSHSFTPLTQEETITYTKNINKLIKYCKNNHIKLYIIIFPNKEFLYQEKDCTHNKVANEKTKAFIDYVKAKTGFEIIYPVKELLNLKKYEYAGFKTDHHLTDSSEFIAYNLLMKKIKKDFPDIYITPETDFKISYNNLVRFDAKRNYTNGAQYNDLGIHDDKSLLKAKYKYYDYKYPDKIKIRGVQPVITHNNSNGKYKMFMITNSFGESLAYFLNTSFYEVKKFRYNLGQRNLDMNRFIPLISNQKPNILLIVLSSGYVDDFGSLYPRGEK